MKKVITKEIKTCDLCGAEVENFASASEYVTPVIISVTVSRYWQNDSALDICEECSRKLKKIINENFSNKIE